MSTASFVNQLYQQIFGRDADAGGLAFWVNQIDGGHQSSAQVILDLINSPEGQAVAVPIASLYTAVFNRSADTGGLLYWEGQLRAGALPVNIANAFLNSTEFSQENGNINTLTNQQYVNWLYQNVLERQPDSGGESYWLTQLQSGESRASVLLGFVSSNEFIAKFTPTVNASLVYSGLYTTQPDDPEADQFAEGYSSSAQTGVPEVGLINQALVDYNETDPPNPAPDVIPPTEGDTYTLTNYNVTGIPDNIRGTNLNDTIQAGDGSWNDADAVNGNGGTDTMNVTFATRSQADTGDNGFLTPNIKSVEIINSTVLNGLSGGMEIDLSLASGITQWWSVKSTEWLELDHATTDMTFGMKNTQSDAEYYVYFDNVNGVNDTANFVLEGAKSDDGGIEVGSWNSASATDGIEIINIKTQGAPSVLDWIYDYDDTVVTLNISGNQHLTINDVELDAVTKIDASAMTGGGVDLGIWWSDADITVIGSKFDDRFATEALDDKQYTIDAGEGRDTISFSDGSSLDATSGPLLKGFEVLEVGSEYWGGGYGTYDLSHLSGIKEIQVNTYLDDNVLVDNVQAGTDLTFTADESDYTLEYDLAVDTANDSLNLKLDAGNTEDGADVDGLIINDIENLNIESITSTGNPTGDIGYYNTISLDATDLKTLKATGNFELDIDLSNTPNLSKVDASGLSDSGSASGYGFYTDAPTNSLNGVQYIGGASADVFESNQAVDKTAGDVFNGGGSADELIGSDYGVVSDTFIYTAQSDSTLEAYDSIDQFDTLADNGLIDDIIDVGAFDFTGNQASGLADKGALTAIDPGTASTDFFQSGAVDRGVAFGTFDGNTYAYVDVNKDGNFEANADMVIELVGLDYALTTANFTY